MSVNCIRCNGTKFYTFGGMRSACNCKAALIDKMEDKKIEPLKKGK
jgi:hypothetical protein